MTDNGIEFNTGDDEVKSYSFQLQPVYAMSFEKFNFISRAVFPILTNVGGEPPPGRRGRPGAKLLPRAAGPGYPRRGGECETLSDAVGYHPRSGLLPSGTKPVRTSPVVQI